MSTVPQYFADNLQQRTFRHKFKNIGNPYAFLSDVGIVPMLEFLYKGNTILDLAAEMDIAVTILRRWIKEENHTADVEEAERVSAEGYLAKAHKKLREANNEFEFKKAKEELNHARFMATKKDKPGYGEKIPGQLGSGNGVTFVLNMQGAAPQATAVLTALPAEGTGPQTLVIEHDPLGAPPAYVKTGA